jgi:antitoxin (DNA-binding transcriptional repressor) of toxin-antitoxin stability system
MKKNISTQNLKTHVGEIVDAVRLRGDRYIIERRGKAVAAIVPLSVNENDERQRRRFFELLQDVRQQSQDVPAQQVEDAIAQAVVESRNRKREQRRQA